MNNNIKAEIVTITAEKAEEMLARNTRNRGISDANISNLTNALRRGEWKLNGEAIKVTTDGTILDGQHRLLACAATGISIQTFLITGLPAEAQVTMDTGKSRSASDVLKLAGFHRTKLLAAVTAAIIRADLYSIRASVDPGGRTYPVSRQQILSRVESDQSMIDLTAAATRYNKIGLSGVVAAVLMYKLSQIDADDCDYFFEKLYSGENMERGNPILTLRNQLIGLKSEVKGTRSKVYITAIAIQAWNKFRAGDKATLLKFTPGGANPMKFPEPK